MQMVKVKKNASVFHSETVFNFYFKIFLSGLK